MPEAIAVCLFGAFLKDVNNKIIRIWCTDKMNKKSVHNIHVYCVCFQWIIPLSLSLSLFLSRRLVHKQYFSYSIMYIVLTRLNIKYTFPFLFALSTVSLNLGHCFFCLFLKILPTQSKIALRGGIKKLRNSRV